MWLVGSVRVFAPIRSAVAFSCSGEIVRSLDAMTNQLGLVRQAAFVMIVPRIAPESLLGLQTYFCIFRGEILCEVFADTLQS
jgi:hypothetical protein